MSNSPIDAECKAAIERALLQISRSRRVNYGTVTIEAQMKIRGGMSETTFISDKVEESTRRYG